MQQAHHRVRASKHGDNGMYTAASWQLFNLHHVLLCAVKIIRAVLRCRGGMVFTFLAARGLPVGASLVEADKVDTARQLEALVRHTA